MKAAVISVTVAAALGWTAVRNAQLPQGPSRLHWGGVVFGHRGCRNVPGIPENTLDAFRYAASRGCGGVECDVRLTKDNEVVVFHDAFVDDALKPTAFARRGEAEARLRVCDLTLFELKEYAFGADPTEQIRVPTLEESVLLCRENNLKLLIEIKEVGKPRLCADKVLDLYRRYPDFMYKETTVISFLPDILYYVRSKDREVAVGQIYSGQIVRRSLENPSLFEKPPPLLARLCPALADRALKFVQERVMPWVGGCSLVCPRFDIFAADPQYKKRWHSRRIGVYLWGFESAEQCTLDMRSDGCFVSADDRHEEYAAPKAAPNFDIFGDQERERQREEDERRKQLRLKK